MPRITADINVRGHLDAIRQFLGADAWKEFWDDAQVDVVHFAALRLEDDSPDLLIWETCQGERVVLFTANRNHEGPDSLGEAIRTLNRPDSLPVITLGDPYRFWRDRGYAERAAVKLLEYLTNLNDYLGAGRIYVP